MNIRSLCVYLTISVLSFSLSSCICTMFSKKQTVTVKSDVDGAAVYCGKKYVGTTPCTFRTKKAKSTITVSKSGYTTQSINTVVKPRGNAWLEYFAFPLTYFWFYDWAVGTTQKFKETNYFVSLNNIEINQRWNYIHDNGRSVFVCKETRDAINRTSWSAKAYETKLIKEKEKEQTKAKPTASNTTSSKPVTKTVPAPIADSFLSSSTLARISIAQKTKQPKPNLEPKTIYKKYKDAVFMIFTSDNVSIAQGSGFFVSSSGIAISNYHVFKGTYKGNEIIKLTNGNTYKVEEVLAMSEKYDYIVFKVNGSGFPYIPVCNRGCEIGEKVVAIGSPLGLENTLSDGLVSQLRDDFIIQISVPIDHGSSGGALINAKGEVIGITSGGIDTSGANLNYARDIRAALRTGNTY